MSKRMWVFFILIIGFLVSFYGVKLLSNCEKNIDECLFDKEYLFSDFHQQYNSIKYVASYGKLPRYAPLNIDGGIDGVSVDGESYEMENAHNIMSHAPLHPYLMGYFYRILKFLNINEKLFFLHLCSIVMVLLGNIFFYFFVKEVSNKKNFIFYSLSIFIFLPVYLHLAISVQKEVLFSLFFLISLFFYSKLIKNKDRKYAVVFGICNGLALLSSRIGVILIIAIFLFIIKMQIEKKFEKRNLFLISFIISIILGFFGFLRNYLLFGDLFPEKLSHWNPGDLMDFVEVIPAFWGGIYGGNNSIKIFVGLSGLIIGILLIYGFFVYFTKIRKKNDLDYLIFIGLATMVMGFSYTCDLFTFLSSFKCVGFNSLQMRYLIPIFPLVGIFSGFGFVELERRNKYLKKIIPLIVIIICGLFVIDFISALM